MRLAPLDPPVLRDLLDLQDQWDLLDQTVSQERPVPEDPEDLQVLLGYQVMPDHWEILAYRVHKGLQELLGRPVVQAQEVPRE